MRFVRPTVKTPTNANGGGLDYARYTPGRPQWLVDWIADQPHFVLLQCGHKDNITARGVMVVKALLPKGKPSQFDVFCETCNAFKRVTRKMGKLEYLGIKPAELPDVPLF